MDAMERRLFLAVLGRDLRATEHLGNLLWLPEKPTYEDYRESWRYYRDGGDQ